MKASIRFDAASIEIRKESPWTGAIWIEADETAFPETQWRDFPIVILGWWARSVTRLTSGESDRELMDFMDGSFAVAVEHLRDGTWSLTLQTERRAGIEERTIAVDFASFLESLIAAIAAALEFCPASHGGGDDIVELRAAQAALITSF